MTTSAESTCPWCGGPVTQTPGRRRRIYCSIACRTFSNNEKSSTREDKTQPPKRRGPRKSYESTGQCLQCACELTGQRRRFCSEVCAETYWNASRDKGVRATYHLLTEVDEQARTAVCSQCGPTRIISAGTTPKVDGSRMWKCPGSVYKDSQLHIRWEADWRKRGIHITAAEFLRKWDEQQEKCAICQRDFEPLPMRPHVDHCHEARTVRALLCSPCNTGLDQFGDDPARLRAAADYLERYAAPEPAIHLGSPNGSH